MSDLHTHFQDVCSCGAIIAQCKCPDAHKHRNIVVNGCEKCLPRLPDAESVLAEPREITDHMTTPHERNVQVFATDPQKAGGANNSYELRVNGRDNAWTFPLAFQSGPIPQGVNGITNEALLAIVIDRIRSFQAGPYPCHENAQALVRLEEAMNWLHQRTRDRRMRGVEGKFER